MIVLMTLPLPSVTVLNTPPAPEVIVLMMLPLSSVTVLKAPAAPSVASLKTLDAPLMIEVSWAEARRAGVRRKSCWSFILFAETVIL